eukprot:TRINITY_DN9175_c0_g1_i2.p1 TRINITY_DN9175_c0_g1~~TRINITY_DN9175_c0_g1_i2.p1  ORF type:complete len:377 (-),score=81.81 TRINITY_DN9175_c0_g1_i2:23-1153(-)
MFGRLFLPYRSRRPKTFQIFKNLFCNKTTLPIEVKVQSFLQKLKQKDRRTLAKAITLVESSNPSDREISRRLLDQILKQQKQNQTQSSFRVGLSGPPGVGKSTFIETFGLHVLGSSTTESTESSRLAVLAVDPSSNRTGGSILADKTRMYHLSKDDRVYVRPSPSRGTLGGVTKTTNEAILLCEEAGFDIILIETVGVGQSEIAVSDMVDMFVLLVPPAGGDELQGIKKGIVELVDMIIVTKDDGDLKPAAKKAQYEYMSALKLLKPKSSFWNPAVIRCSSLDGSGVDSVWRKIKEYRKIMEENGEMQRNRASQRKIWMWKLIEEEFWHRLKNHPSIKSILSTLESRVEEGSLNPTIAAEEIIDVFRNGFKDFKHK